MRTILYFLTLTLSLGSMQASESARRSLTMEEWVTFGREEVALHSKHNSDVSKAADLFLSHLVESYQRGEGMIQKDIDRIIQAMAFSSWKHRNQMRKDEKTPYIIHPIGVADHLLQVGNVRDSDILIAGLLHDTVEDTDTSFEEIRTLFGSRVEGFVRELSDDRTLSQAERKAAQVEHAGDKSAGAAQVKLADKWYNLRDSMSSTPVGWSKERIDQYFDWAEKVVHALPWVNRALLEAVDDLIALHRKE